MLHSFSLSNFKAFGSEQRIPLRPITLIFGANSSGKSSILHALLLARHALDTGDWDVTNPRIAGDSVDLGGFSNYLHRKDRNPVGAVTMSFDRILGPDFQPRSRLLPYAKELRLTLNIASAGAAHATLRDCRVDVDGSRLFLLTPKSSGQMSLNVWETTHPLSERLIAWCIQAAALPGDSAQYGEAVIHEIVAMQQSASLDALGFMPTDIIFEKDSRESSRSSPSDRLRTEVHRIFSESVRDILADLHRLFANDLRSLEYLGPLRSYPSRQLLDNETTDPNWHAGGGFAWKKVKDDAAVRTKVNTWLEQNPKSKYRLDVRRLADEETIRRRLGLGLADHDAYLITQIASREEREGSIADEIGLTSLNCRDYLAANTGLHERLAEYWHDAHQSHLADCESQEMANAYTMEEARADVLDTLSGDNPLYWEQVREHYLDNHPEIPNIAASLSDPVKSAEWMTEGIMKEAESTRTELALIDLSTNTSVTHRDVGIGISQVLPVLVHAFASKNKLIAIEQPEIHLHPALQAELGDLFIESALGENGNQFILETHSEHLILRLLRRVRETTEGEIEEGKRALRPDDISVLFVEPTDQGSRVIELPVTADGDFSVPWPGGFFAERTKELF